LAALLMIAPATASAGDGTFGVPASGILLPPPPQPPKIPAKSAALIPPDRADRGRERPAPRVQQSYQPAPAEGAGSSRAAPPSEAPIHSPIVVPPKKKQFKAPLASIDPSYVERLAPGSNQPDARSAEPMPVTPPVMAQGTAPEPKRGLFNMLRRRSAQPQMAQMQVQPQAAPGSAAAAAYEEHGARAPAPAAYASQPAPQRTASRFSFGGANPSARANDGTPCAQRRGIFTSPPECR
jgi:hypothetical protein